MIKILYCTDYLSAGGVESQTTALVTGLDRTRFEPHVLCFYGKRAGRSLQFEPAIREAGVPLDILDLTFDRRSKIRAFREIIRQTWRLRPHIVHAVNYHGSILIGAARPFLPPKTKLVISVRAENTRKQMLTQQVSWRFCSHIIVNSPHLVEALVHAAHLPRRKITRIPNGLDAEHFAPSDNPASREKIAPGAHPMLLMLTRIDEKKAPHLLPEALGLLKSQGKLPEQLQAFIVGEGRHSHEQDRIDTAIAHHHLEATVYQHPQTDHTAEYYHAADVVVLSSLSESLPNVALESFAAGVPVIISEGANKAQVIEHGVTGWIVRNNDAEHLAETLHHVFTLSEETLQTMRNACRQRAHDYSMEKMVNRHQDLYERILGG